ncbi:hypothetical protein DN730_00150 [Marinomonas piezotolerans]|uniref:Uncharacterized protein n=1 Tax=Marinomonas piezotolerans TaxID=2213058 RepID=A0A370UCP9_9GAMM|nr:hypothetical protein [Marinomonas piezotolerans]RDL45501.1 hypothetical protein DN730_00150 [Marinomonas piezotolerans]
MSTTSTSRLLTKYGVLVEDIGNHVKNLDRIPHSVPDETFKQWKERLFGENVPDMAMYVPWIPPQQTRMSTLKDICASEHILRAMKEYRALSQDEADSVAEDARRQLKEAKKQVSNVEASKKDLENQLAEKDKELKAINTIPIEMLEDLFTDLGDEVQPSVKEFMERYLEEDHAELDTRKLLAQLLGLYNRAVTQYRKIDPNLK